jgi:hypothetical protein
MLHRESLSCGGISNPLWCIASTRCFILRMKEGAQVKNIRAIISKKISVSPAFSSNCGQVNWRARTDLLD